MVFVGLVLAAGFYWGWQTWEEVVGNESEHLQTLSAAVATSTHATLHGLQISLQLLDHQLEGIAGRGASSQAYPLMHWYLQMQPQVAAVGIATADGGIFTTGKQGKALTALWQELSPARSSSPTGIPLSAGQRHALRACLQSARFCVGPPVEIHTKPGDAGIWTIPMRQPSIGRYPALLILLPLAQGRLPSWQHLPIRTEGSLYLLQTNGFLEARFPVPTATSFAVPQSGIAVRYLQSHPNLQSGTFVGLAKAADQWRMGAMVRVPGYPLVAGVGIGYMTLWARWWDLFQGTFWGLLVLLGLSILGYRFLRSIDREREGAAQALWENRERAEVTLRSIGDAVVVTDYNGQIRDANPAAERLLNLYCPEDCGQTLNQFLTRDESVENEGSPHPATESPQRELQTTQSPVQVNSATGEPRWIERSAAPMHDREGGEIGMVWVLRDVTEHRRLQEQLAYQATHDMLTNLPNRRLFLARLGQYHDQTLYPGSLMVGILDLDGFKQINDRYGHGFGDALLQEVAQRLQQLARGSLDVVARLGGDEFAVLFPGIESIAVAKARAQAVLDTLRTPLEVEGMNVLLSASLGLTYYPADDTVSAELLRHADLALYAAKDAGRDSYRFFHEDMDQFQDRSMEICRMTEAALEQGCLVLHYQPIVEAQGGPVGVEALLRMHHPERGLLPPAAFASALDSPRLARRIGQFVLATALRQNQSWHQQGIPLRVSINISPHHLLDPAFFSDLQTALAAHPDLPADAVEIEVTETAPLQDFRKAQEVLLACHQLGVRVALDDFGTGSASLTYLQKLPAHTIKIDQSFVRDILHDPKDYAIVSGVVTSARLLGLDVIAEGVETLEHAALLHQLQCQCFQGYAIARPMPAEQIPDWVSRYNPLFAQDDSTNPNQ